MAENGHVETKSNEINVAKRQTHRFYYFGAKASIRNTKKQAKNCHQKNVETEQSKWEENIAKEKKT